jgi:hypothetical protein
VVDEAGSRSRGSAGTPKRVAAGSPQWGSAGRPPAGSPQRGSADSPPGGNSAAASPNLQAGQVEVVRHVDAGAVGVPPEVAARYAVPAVEAVAWTDAVAVLQHVGERQTSGHT